MTNPYTSVSVSSYNADPPSDDASATANNQLTWSKHKTKLSDPLKTAIEAVNSNITTAFGKIFGQDVTSVATNYTVTAADQGKIIEGTATLTITLLPAATAGSTFPLLIVNAGSGIVTVDGDGSETINGVTSVYLGPGESLVLTCNGTSWTGGHSRRLPNRLQSKSGNYTVLITDDGSWVEVTAAATITLLAAATATNEFRLAVFNTGAGVVTLDANGSETINGEQTITLHHGVTAFLVCDGSGWTAVLCGNDSQAKYKAADETVNNSTTLQDDDHLAGYVLATDAYYKVAGAIIFTGSVAADAKIQLTFSSAPQKFMLTTAGGSSVTHGTPISITFSATTVYMYVHGFFRTNATTGGTVTLQWAQDTAEASDTKLLEGSWLEIQRIG